MVFKALLAANKLHENLHLLDQLPYPVIGSPKLDGIRALRRRGTADERVRQYSRSTDDKTTPNLYVQEYMAGLPAGLDGEYIVGKETDPHSNDPGYVNVYRRTMSGVQSVDGEPDFRLFLFDTFTDLVMEDGNLNLLAPYEERLARLLEWYEENNIAVTHPRVVILEHRILHNKEELLAYEEELLELGYEGLMIRLRHVVYKCGRYSINFLKNSAQGGLMKLKRESDGQGGMIEVLEDEAIILDFKEAVHNGNEARRDPTGRLRRRGLNEFKVGKDTLGSFLVECPKFRKTFSLKGNISEAEAQLFWDKREELRGQLIKFTYQERGSFDRPRFPRFLGFRDRDDL